MKRISDIYKPITATPFLCDDTYTEIEPCDALKPYIRCFWGSNQPISSFNNNDDFGLVIPDTCMDIIFDINYTRNKLGALFCTVDENSYKTSSENSNLDLTATFAIRFYAHASILFAERDFGKSKNKIFEAEYFFEKLKKELEILLIFKSTLIEKVEAAEHILLKHLNLSRINNDFNNALYYMISSRGCSNVSDICAYASVSSRTLERIFDYNIGISPKSFSLLIRYQLLWQDMILKRSFNVLDAVEKYAFTDQSHLLREFKKRHLMLPKEAIVFAKK